MPIHSSPGRSFGLLGSLALALGACGAPDATDLEGNAPPPERVLSVGSPLVSLDADGKSAVAYSYAAAIRERVFIPVPGIDQNGDSLIDRVAVDIMRPLETASTLKVPAIIFASPYMTSVGEGRENELLHTTTGGVADKFPLFYDNYFVPRGYAFLAVHALGTGFSTGCALHGGPGDVAAIKAVVDWLQDRIPGYAGVTGAVVKSANWDNGKSALVGKSYDGALAEGAAATGVLGLTTIVPIAAVSEWYGYSRANGIRYNTHYPASLLTSVETNKSATVLGVAPPDNTAGCASARSAMSAADGDDTGDLNGFWTARTYDGSKVKASVFAVHGLNDDNVRPDQLGKWWTGISSVNVPRKLWLSQEGHTDPFDFRRATWVDKLHRWFDYWLLDVPNGIMSEPRVDIETAKDTWATASNWPLPDAIGVDLFLRGTEAGAAGVLSLGAAGALDALTFADAKTQNEATMINTPTGSQANRLVFLSPMLSSDLHLSGTPVVELRAAFNATQSNLGALLVDYGDGSHVTRSGDGLSATTTSTCWGDTLGIDDGCYFELSKPTVTVNSWRVSKGILDSSNRDSLLTAAPMTVGTQYRFVWPLLMTEYVIPAGHQLGVILVGDYPGYTSIAATTASQITVDATLSKITLPVVGGSAAMSAAFEPAPIADAGADAAPTEDAGLPTGDAALPDNDAALPDNDAALPESDAAPPDNDAALPESDAAAPGAVTDGGAGGVPGEVAAAGEAGIGGEAGQIDEVGGGEAGGAPNGSVDAGNPSNGPEKVSASGDDAGCSCDIGRSAPQEAIGYWAAACLAITALRRRKASIHRL